MIEAGLEESYRGIFVKELKNRFRCLVDIDGTEQVCYVPASCKLGNFIDLSGRVVWLKKLPKHSGLKYSLFALETKQGLVLLNLAYANRVIEQQIHRRFFSFLGKRTHVLREQVFDGYKCDLFITDTNTIVEIKTVLTLDRHAHFPSVYSERAEFQLNHLQQLLAKGYNVCFIFVGLGPHIKSISIDCDEAFTNAFNYCVQQGMTYEAVRLVTTCDGKTAVKSKIPLDW